MRKLEHPHTDKSLRNHSTPLFSIASQALAEIDVPSGLPGAALEAVVLGGAVDVALDHASDTALGRGGAGGRQRHDPDDEVYFSRIQTSCPYLFPELLIALLEVHCTLSVRGIQAAAEEENLRL